MKSRGSAAKGLTLSFLSFLCLPYALAQSCDNYGVQNGSSCTCPPGTGGPSCSDLACGGTLFQGSSRRLTPSGGLANLTSAGCSCESGWGGTACNVCQTADACRVGLNSVSSSSATGGVASLGGAGVNSTLVCNTSPRVYAASHMSCQINNPTLQALYPRPASVNIVRTLDPTLTPLPNVTSFGPTNSAHVSIFYAGVEQFFCRASPCTQTIASSNSADWSCQNLQCSCRNGTNFCSGFLTGTINSLSGSLNVSCSSSSCNFKQSTLQNLVGPSGLALDSCTFGECVRQNVIDSASPGSSGSQTNSTHTSLGSGVIAGLAVVGSLVLASLLLLAYGFFLQRRQRNSLSVDDEGIPVGVEWAGISYLVPGNNSASSFKGLPGSRGGDKVTEARLVLDDVSGRLPAGNMMAVLGPSGAGKTTLIEIIAGKRKSGRVTGHVSFFPTRPTSPDSPVTTSSTSIPTPRIGFVPQQDILPPTLTVSEALLFAARLRLPESTPDKAKQEMVAELMSRLGISHLADARIGYAPDKCKGRGISGGEMRRVSIGLELIARPDVLILDEPTSGLDSVSASRIAQVLYDIAHDPVRPIPVIASIHQPNSHIYQIFDSVLLLSGGHALYSGPGRLAPTEYFAHLNDDAGTGKEGGKGIPLCPPGYNVADWLLEVASEPGVQMSSMVRHPHASAAIGNGATLMEKPKNYPSLTALDSGRSTIGTQGSSKRVGYAATYLTQFQVLAGREMKILRRDKTLFVAHICVACVLGVFCGGLYYKTDTTIAGFQSRVGCLFFLGSLIAFSVLSALHNVVETRPLFLRERSGMYYSPSAWLLSRFLFDVIPLRLVPTIIVSTVTYWMAGLAPEAANFFKFLLVLVLYTLALTLFNFLLGTAINNGGLAILLSALSALYQMTFAGFFVHLSTIPPVLRWLQWLCPLKYALEALTVNEVNSGLTIQDKVQGVPVNIDALLVLKLLFGYNANNYYRDILVLFGFIAGFAAAVIGVVWLKVREQR